MGLPAGLFDFLAKLKENNDRTWVQASKSCYEKQVKGPLLAFIGASTSVWDASAVTSWPTRGRWAVSLFRIYRVGRTPHPSCAS